MIAVLRVTVGIDIIPDGFAFAASVDTHAEIPPDAVLAPALITAIQAAQQELDKLRPNLPAELLAEIDALRLVPDEPK